MKSQGRMSVKVEDLEHLDIFVYFRKQEDRMDSVEHGQVWDGELD